MNKYILLIALAIIAIGGLMILGGKKENPVPPAIQEAISTPAQTAPKEEIVTVALANTGFAPKEIIVKKGTKVVWTNSSGKTATVDSADHPAHLLHPFLNLGNFADGATLEVVFDKSGKYNYHNHYNSSETGIITVE